MSVFINNTVCYVKHVMFMIVQMVILQSRLECFKFVRISFSVTFFCTHTVLLHTVLPVYLLKIATFFFCFVYLRAFLFLLYAEDIPQPHAQQTLQSVLQSPGQTFRTAVHFLYFRHTFA